jgi:hypothetical protein
MPARMLAGGAFDPTNLSHFGAYHGTRRNIPFTEFTDEALRSGQGHMTYGSGHYVAQEPKVSSGYRGEGGRQVPLDEEGMPLSSDEVFLKYYEPGNIVPGYGGYDRVIESGIDDGLGSRWARVRRVTPDTSKLLDPTASDQLTAAGRKALNTLRQTGGSVPIDAPIGRGYLDLINAPELWRDLNNEGARFINTLPGSIDIETLAGARGWKMGQPGALLHVNVIPEEHEFLDWDLPFSKQHPDVQKKLTDAGIVHPQTNWDPTGEDIYNGISSDLRMDTGMHWEDAWNEASQRLKEAGIPGNKYLDQWSRSRPEGETIIHNKGLLNAPDLNTATQYLSGMPRITDSIEKEIQAVKGNIGLDIRGLEGNIHGIEYELKHGNSVYMHPEDAMENMQNQIGMKRELLDWIDKEHEAGNFSFGDARTRNFVVFDPKHLDIRAWNGRPLTPTSVNPFTGKPYVD